MIVCCRGFTHVLQMSGAGTGVTKARLGMLLTDKGFIPTLGDAWIAEADLSADIQAAVEARVNEMRTRQDMPWIKPPRSRLVCMDGDGRVTTAGDTPWLGWLASMEAANAAELQFEPLLHHFVLAAIGAKEEVEVLPETGGGTPGSRRKRLYPVVFYGPIAKGRSPSNIDFFVSRVDDSASLGLELKTPSEMQDNKDKHVWQAVAQCDALLGTDRADGFVVLTGLRRWVFIRMQRFADGTKPGGVVSSRLAGL